MLKGESMSTDTAELRALSASEIDRELFRSFDRRQVVTKCRRKIDGEWRLVDDPFVDDWSEADYAELIADLRSTVSTGGAVFGAFVGGVLKGFCSVEGAPIGSRGDYIDLTSLHVSAELRSRGLGRELFLAAAEKARALDGRKLYISSHSSAESQAFYRAMGCREAEEYSAQHVLREPCDCQLEFVL